MGVGICVCVCGGFGIGRYWGVCAYVEEWVSVGVGMCMFVRVGGVGVDGCWCVWGCVSWVNAYEYN